MLARFNVRRSFWWLHCLELMGSESVEDASCRFFAFRRAIRRGVVDVFGGGDDGEEWLEMRVGDPRILEGRGVPAWRVLGQSAPWVETMCVHRGLTGSEVTLPNAA